MPVITPSYPPVIPTGEYPVEVEKVEPTKGRFGPQITWALIVVGEGEYSGTQLRGYTSQSPSPKGKLVKWANACGLETELDVPFDTDDLKGTRAVAVVLVKEREEGGLRNDVDDLISMQGRKRSTTPPPSNLPPSKADPFLLQEE